MRFEIRRARAIPTGFALAALAFGASEFASAGPAAAQQGACEATKTMRGGKNNYRPGAPVVENLGTGFTVTGTVREAGSCQPLANARLQIWTATERGGERDPSNVGSVLTGPDGTFVFETSPVVPNFGQPHIHVAFDDPSHETVFLRPVLDHTGQTAMEVNLNLAPAEGGTPGS